MKTEELNKFLEMYNQFIEDCERVQDKLGNLKDFRGEICFAEHFHIDGTNVYWEGEEALCYGGGYEYHSGEFDVKFLAMSDEELDEYVKHENEIFEQKKKEEEEAKAKSNLETKKRLYEKLKAELGIENEK